MAYTNEQYLLDKVHVADVVNNMYWLADAHQLDQLAKQCFAPRLTVDYSSIFGTPAKELTAEEQAKEWSQLLPMLEDSSHLIVPSPAELPVPDGKIATPTTAKIGGQVRVYMRRVRNGETLHSSGVGRNYFELVRTEEPGNPWRITYLRAHSIHREGALDFWAQ